MQELKPKKPTASNHPPKDKNHQLKQAILDGNLGKVKHLMEASPELLNSSITLSPTNKSSLKRSRLQLEKKKIAPSKEDIDRLNPLSEMTPLMLAVVSRHQAIVQHLLKQGPIQIDKNSAGMTALMLAVESNQPEVIALLIEKGASLIHKNTKGQTAYDLALEYLTEYQKNAQEEDPEYLKMLEMLRPKKDIKKEPPFPEPKSNTTPETKISVEPKPAVAASSATSVSAAITTKPSVVAPKPQASDEAKEKKTRPRIKRSEVRKQKIAEDLLNKLRSNHKLRAALVEKVRTKFNEIFLANPKLADIQYEALIQDKEIIRQKKQFHQFFEEFDQLRKQLDPELLSKDQQIELARLDKERQANSPDLEPTKEELSTESPTKGSATSPIVLLDGSASAAVSSSSDGFAPAPFSPSLPGKNLFEEKKQTPASKESYPVILGALRKTDEQKAAKPEQKPDQSLASKQHNAPSLPQKSTEEIAQIYKSLENRTKTLINRLETADSSYTLNENLNKANIALLEEIQNLKAQNQESGPYLEKIKEFQNNNQREEIQWKTFISGALSNIRSLLKEMENSYNLLAPYLKQLNRAQRTQLESIRTQISVKEKQLYALFVQAMKKIEICEFNHNSLQPILDSAQPSKLLTRN